MTAVAVVIAALLIVLAAALWLELRAERQAAARILASYLLDAACEDAPVNLAWGPGGLVRLPRRVAFRPCGCLEFEGGLCSLCLEHDPAFEPPVDRWAREMGDL